MSLLLDALKRAEQAKQSAQPDLQSEPASPQRSDADAAVEPPAGGSTLSLEAIAEAPRPAQTRAMEATDRDAVRNVFAAKQGTTASNAGSKPVWLLPVIAVVIVAGGGGGWFVWNEINKIAPAVRVAAAPAPKPLTSATPAPQPAAGPGLSDAKPGVDAQSAAEPSSAEQKLSGIPLPDRVSGSRSALSPTERAREELARSLRANTAATDAPVTLKLARAIDPPKVSEALAEAYGALRAGKNADARKQYESLVRADGLNLDARLGLATALARSGEVPAALREYKKALEIDPRNSTALAGLLILTDASSAPSLETDLRALLSRHGDSAELHYALGNLLASQSRWTEAQQAYFDAWRHGGDNADYAFNLAVSLDQLRQSRLAAEYYQRALALSVRHGGQFDRKQAERRVNELKSAQAQQ